jgi:hypothetical protein
LFRISCHSSVVKVRRPRRDDVRRRHPMMGPGGRDVKPGDRPPAAPSRHDIASWEATAANGRGLPASLSNGPRRVARIPTSVPGRALPFPTVPAPRGQAAPGCRLGVRHGAATRVPGGRCSPPPNRSPESTGGGAAPRRSRIRAGRCSPRPNRSPESSGGGTAPRRSGNPNARPGRGRRARAVP